MISSDGSSAGVKKRCEYRVEEGRVYYPRRVYREINKPSMRLHPVGIVVRYTCTMHDIAATDGWRRGLHRAG